MRRVSRLRLLYRCLAKGKYRFALQEQFKERFGIRMRTVGIVFVTDPDTDDIRYWRELGREVGWKCN